MSAASGAAGGQLRGSPAALVQRYWAQIQARRWAQAQALLAPTAVCTWWATRERFEGAASIIHVNAVYPEGWSLCLLELQPLPDGRVLSLLRVDHDGHSFYATSFFALENGQIRAIDEYWCDVQAAPDWRVAQPLPGCRPLAGDTRPGLALSIEVAEP